MEQELVERAVKSIRSAAARMQADERFKVVFEDYPARQEDDFLTVEEWIGSQPGMEGFRIPDQVRAIYSATGGFLYQWQYLPGGANKVITGSAHLVTVIELYHDDEEVEAGKPMTTIYDEARRFDIISDDEFVGINFLRDAPEQLSMLYVDNEAGSKQLLSLNPLEYMQALALFLGSYGWQRLYIGKRDDAAIEARKKDIASLLNTPKP